MSTIRTTVKEFSVINHIALQLKAQTGHTVPVKAEYKAGAVMVTAPSSFLEYLGF